MTSLVTKIPLSAARHLEPAVQYGYDETLGLIVPVSVVNNGLQVAPLHQGGEESVESQYDSRLRVTEDWKYVQVDHGDDPVTVFTGNCRIGRIYVIEALAGDTCVIQDDSTEIVTIPAAFPAINVTWEALLGFRVTTSLVFNFGASATAGTFLVAYREADFS